MPNLRSLSLGGTLGGKFNPPATPAHLLNSIRGLGRLKKLTLKRWLVEDVSVANNIFDGLDELEEITY